MQKAVIPVGDEQTLKALQHVSDLIRSEVNVKELQIVRAEDSEVKLVKKIKPNFKVLGKKLGGNMKAAAAEITAMSQDQIAAMGKDGQYQLSTVNYQLIPEDVEIITEDMPGWLVMNEGNLTIALDIELTDILIEEGVARELINRIQNLRKSSGLDITDRINVVLSRHPQIEKAVEHFNDYIASQVLAAGIVLADNVEGETVEMDNYSINIQIKKA